MKHSLRFVLPFAVAACARATPAVVVAEPDRPFALAPEGMATLADGATLRYTSLVEDSRCRPDVQCVWAGTVRVAVAIVRGTSTRIDTVDLTRAPRSTRVGDWSLRFAAFDPAPPAGGATIPLAETRATFVMTRPD